MRNMSELIKGLFLVGFLITATSGVCGGSPIIDESGNVSNETSSTDVAANNHSDKGSASISVPVDIVGGSKDTSNGQRSSRCPPANHSLQLNEQTANNHGNDEGHVTAFGKLSESIHGVLSTIQKSVQSIFSPGTGLAEEEKDMNCSLALPANNSSSASVTSGEHADDVVGDKLGENGLLIHPLSSNDTNNSTTTSTTSPTTTSTPDIDTSSSEETNSPSE